MSDWQVETDTCQLVAGRMCRNAQNGAGHVTSVLTDGNAPNHECTIL